MPKDGEAHWYWQLYDIPATISSLAKNTKNIGIVGTNSKNKDLAYTPPCSQGPGAKTYTLTLYALSVEPKILVSKDAITRDTLLTAMKNITLASSSLDIVYSR